MTDFFFLIVSVMELLVLFVQILRCINHLSGDPNCLETLQRTDAIKHLIPILELHDGPLVYQIHSEVRTSLFYPSMLTRGRKLDQLACPFRFYVVKHFESILLTLSCGPCFYISWLESWSTALKSEGAVALWYYVCVNERSCCLYYIASMQFI